MPMTKNLKKALDILSVIDQQIMLCDNSADLIRLAEIMIYRSKLILDYQLGIEQRKIVIDEINSN